MNGTRAINEDPRFDSETTPTRVWDRFTGKCVDSENLRRRRLNRPKRDVASGHIAGVAIDSDARRAKKRSRGN
jgi:hypothetical protein